VLQSPDLPVPLPADDRRFLAAVRDAALIADGLMLLTGAPLIAVPLTRAGAALLVWDERLSPSADRLRLLRTVPMFRAPLEALRRAAEAAGAALADAGRDAGGLVLLTDGTGALVTRAPENGAGPEWLIATARDVAARPVLTFDPEGVWPLLCGEDD